MKKLMGILFIMCYCFLLSSCESPKSNFKNGTYYDNLYRYNSEEYKLVDGKLIDGVRVNQKKITKSEYEQTNGVNVTQCEVTLDYYNIDLEIKFQGEDNYKHYDVILDLQNNPGQGSKQERKGKVIFDENDSSRNCLITFYFGNNSYPNPQNSGSRIDTCEIVVTFYDEIEEEVGQTAIVRVTCIHEEYFELLGD